MFNIYKTLRHIIIKDMTPRKELKNRVDASMATGLITIEEHKELTDLLNQKYVKKDEKEPQ